MGLYRVVNVPTEQSGMEIEGVVEGENVLVIARARGPDSKWRDGKSRLITETLVGDHMLIRPHDLRRMYASDLASAIRLARDAGYGQAQAVIRAALGIFP